MPHEVKLLLVEGLCSIVVSLLWLFWLHYLTPHKPHVKEGHIADISYPLRALLVGSVNVAWVWQIGKLQVKSDVFSSRANRQPNYHFLLKDWWYRFTVGSMKYTAPFMPCLSMKRCLGGVSAGIRSEFRFLAFALDRIGSPTIICDNPNCAWNGPLVV